MESSTPAANIKLTEFSRGAGCGCKIAPQVLEQILHSNISIPSNSKLIVGNESRDDAAVYDLGNGQGLISTTDFFTPIVDDPFDFGMIAAANSISDIYAMGGRPLLAIAILGWPVERIDPSIAQKVIEGGRKICNEAGIPLAGGHSIDSSDPIFGLAVTGLIELEHLKKNNTAGVGDFIFLTKPLGSGILSTAQKRGVLKTEHYEILIGNLNQLNSIGEKISKIDGVTSMTDVTGFGLLGHLTEMTGNNRMSAEIFYNAIPKMDGVTEYISQRIFPDATTRNWNAYSSQVKFEKGVNVMEAFTLLPDPQTNGGLMFTSKQASMNEVENLLKKPGLELHSMPIGRMIERKEKSIYVLP